MKSFAKIKHSTFLLIGMVFFSACSDDEEVTFNTENTFMNPYIALESSVIHQAMLIDEILRDNSFQQTDSTVIEQEIIAVQTGNTLRITYGASGMGTTKPDGIMRSGALMVNFQGDYGTSGSIYSVSYENIKIQSKTLSGGFDVENTGLNSEGKQSFQMHIDSLIYMGDNSLSTSGRTITWISDFDLQIPKGNRIIQINDQAAVYYNGHNNNTAQVSFPPGDHLEYNDTCMYKITRGIIHMDLANRLSASDEFTLDMVEESVCSSLIRIYSPGKEEFFFLPKEGF
jgi:hypothetical protein